MATLEIWVTTFCERVFFKDNLERELKLANVCARPSLLNGAGGREAKLLPFERTVKDVGATFV